MADREIIPLDELVDALLERLGVDDYDASLDHDDLVLAPVTEEARERIAKIAPAPAPDRDTVSRALFAKGHPRGARGKPEMRKQLRNLALYMWSQRHRIDYSQARPIHGVSPFRSKNQLVKDDQHWLWDCSGGVTWLYRAATRGQVDPNGNGFSGYGYTGTLVAHGRKVTVPKTGDLIFYGSPTISHVTMAIEPGLDARCWSMGSSPGPLILPHDYRRVVAIRRFI